VCTAADNLLVRIGANGQATDVVWTDWGVAKVVRAGMQTSAQFTGLIGTSKSISRLCCGAPLPESGEEIEGLARWI
jgi:hypothetical protein